MDSGGLTAAGRACWLSSGPGGTRPFDTGLAPPIVFFVGAGVASGGFSGVGVALRGVARWPSPRTPSHKLLGGGLTLSAASRPPVVARTR